MLLTSSSAGTTDSALTTHGVLQASRLGSHLATTGARVSYIFSSDLQRAFKTAEAVRVAQADAPESVTQLRILREQDFGYYEGKHFYERPKGSDKSGKEAHREVHLNTEGFRDVESKSSMSARVEVFFNEHLMPLLPFVADCETIAIIAHGIILTHLWRGVLACFHSGDVTVAPGVMAGGAGMGLEYLGGWSNTGYLDLEITSKVGPPSVHLADIMPGSSSRLVVDTVTSIPDSLPLPDVTLPNGSTSSVHVQEFAETSFTYELPVKLPNRALTVKAVNSQEHLDGLKKTRGGIGSLKHDETQKTVDSFFKRQRLG
ncbi:phosphoserine phosphatase 2 [Hyphodiscus hymeniophilus]|uniref:Phosphoserine phosphatase 2 n=1 Tax=Hyphodiscus hymeniophilus TaxID=353542 RepID=A0A9P6VDJ4_9HELO|nr:phosphoserine phosphatase 2 [Hyphodiscus hymeniophilus]